MTRKSAQFDIGHPAPARRKVSLRLVWFGLLAAPAAWSVQLAANSALGALACLSDRGTVAQVFSSWPATLAINLAAVAIALLALAASIRSLRRSQDEQVENSGGVMQAGEGRTRFLAVWGIWTSVLFLIAISANTIAVLWRGLCPT